MIFLPFVDNFICSCGFGTVESMLEPHLKNAAGADQMQIGVTFLILGGVYMVTTPVVGYVRFNIFSKARGCSTAVDSTPTDQEAVGLNSANFWAFYGLALLVMYP